MKSVPNGFSNPSMPGQTMAKSLSMRLFSSSVVLVRSMAARRASRMGLLSAPHSNCPSKKRFGTMVISRMPVCRPNST